MNVLLNYLFQSFSGCLSYAECYVAPLLLLTFAPSKERGESKNYEINL